MLKNKWGALALAAAASFTWAATPESAPETPAEAEAEITGNAQAIGTDSISAAAPATSATLAGAQAHGDMCFFAGSPPAEFKYTVIRKFKVGKGSYGGVKDILPQFAEKAHNLGADAVINYAGSQRFGFWPWRMVRPVAQGVAVKWQTPPEQDCKTLGGSTLATILATDQPPPRH